MTEGIGYIINEGFEGVKETKIVTENAEAFNGKTVAEGILQTANEKNRNGRWYDSSELFPQLECPRTIELLNAGYMRAELGHPMSKGGGAADLARQSTIDDKLTCSRFLKFWVVGDQVWGRFVGTNNEYGRAFDLDLKEGCMPAWSLRALGTVEQTRRGAEVKNLKLITYDQVIYPSHPGAYTQRIVSESAGLIDESVDTTKAVLFPIENQDIISYIQHESANIKFINEYFDFAYSDIKVSNNGTKVILTESATGNTIVVPMEKHIHNEFMTYASKEIKDKFWEE
jgi:hypothetical protein